MPVQSRVLLTGATGFVGSHLHPALVAAGYEVRGLSRSARRARERFAGREFVSGDVADPASLAAALDGCDAAYYLVHGMGEGGGAGDFRRREVAAAHAFAEAAARAGVGRIVYLGGVAPASAPSEHLRSRLEVGEVLRAGRVTTVELRASMIVGHGSLSWLIVRDLAARLPFMVLPRWLASRTEPVAEDDVIVALVRALDVATDGSTWFDIPGPAILSGREILEQTAEVMGRPRPRVVTVPLLTPGLSSQWLRLVTRADWSVARELVGGLVDDLLARDDRYWTLIGHARRTVFREAARRALVAERVEGEVPGAWGLVERMLARLGSAQPA